DGAHRGNNQRAAAAAFCALASPGALLPLAARRGGGAARPTGGGVRCGRQTRRVVNEAGFEVGVMMDPEEAERLGIKPFGDGGEAVRRPKFYTHGPCASPAASGHVVPCAGWRSAPRAERRRLAGLVLEGLRRHGFVVMEKLFDAADVAPLEAEAARHP
ncbi:unnamed protein product, partial [Prorocentrum cordatum]